MSRDAAGRWGMAVLVVASAAVLAAPPASAMGKLIQMRNGRVLRAASVRTEGATLIATLEGGNTIGFPTTVVEGIEDDRVGDNDADGTPNVVRSDTSGAGASAAGGFAPPAMPMEMPQDESDMAPDPSADAPPPPPAQPATGMSLDDNSPNRLPPGLQNTPAGANLNNRRINRLGFKPRPGGN
jgi:hypothetical protein